MLRQLAPNLGVSVHWLETGKEDAATELASRVLENADALPARVADGGAEGRRHLSAGCGDDGELAATYLRHCRLRRESVALERLLKMTIRSTLASVRTTVAE